MYCYGVHQTMFDRMEVEVPNFTLHERLPTKDTLDAFCSEGHHKVILLDDLMMDVVSNVEMEKLFTQGAHHRNLTVIFLTQNMYAKGKNAKTIALNTHVLVLFKSMRSGGQISHLSRELYPSRGKVLVDAYNDDVSKAYGYLVIDLSPHAPCDQHRLRTHIFPDKWPLIVYVPRV